MLTILDPSKYRWSAFQSSKVDLPLSRKWKCLIEEKRDSLQMTEYCSELSDESPVEGLPIPITIDMVKKAISQMKAGKAPGPSGIVVEMIRTAGDMGASMIRDLAAAIIRDGEVPFDWEQSFNVCLYKGKGDALERGNYRGLKLTEQVMKVLERIVDGLIRQVVSINDSQFGFVPGRGTTDAIFVIRQLQEKYLDANKRLYMAFVDLEKAFD